jgi:hypothetical protein
MEFCARTGRCLGALSTAVALAALTACGGPSAAAPPAEHPMSMPAPAATAAVQLGCTRDRCGTGESGGRSRSAWPPTVPTSPWST